MILAGSILVPTGSVDAEPVWRGRLLDIVDGWVAVESGCISRVAAGQRDLIEDVAEVPDGLILPAFTDLHLHLPQFDAIGVDGLDLLAWLDRVIYPAEAAWADADLAGQTATQAAQKLLSHGTVGVCAYGTVHHEATCNAIAVLGGMGLRGVAGQVLMDQQAPDELIRPASQLLDEAATLEGCQRVQPAVTPRFGVSCSDELLRGAGKLARHTGQLIQTHLAETDVECARVRELHGGLGYLDVYMAAGLVNERSIFGHGIWLDLSARSLLAKRGAAIAHCPTANAFLRAGQMDWRGHEQVGVRLGLGSDVGAGPDVSMVRVARATIETAKRLGNTSLTAERMWHQITDVNARLAQTPAGRIEPGQPADLVVCRPSVDWRASVDPLGALLYGWDERWIQQVYALGEPKLSPRSSSQ